MRGSFHYDARDGQWSPARSTKVYLYDSDPGGTDDLLAVTTTSADPNANGTFQFPAVTNWDDDDSDPDSNNRRLDLYVVWETDYNDSATATRRVTDFSSQAYRWSSFVNTNAPDGIVDFSTTLPVGWSNLEAMWIFQDLRRAWEYVRTNSNPQTDPGSVMARWQAGQDVYGLCNGSCFYAGPEVPYITPAGPYVFIANRNILSADTVVHEVGHHYMHNATGWWWWHPACWEHDLFSQEDANCAWSEGWGDFLAIAVNQTLPNNANDTCYDRGIGPCGAGGGAFENLEARNRNDTPPLFPWGDTVEGRVAGALYDLFDDTNEPSFDSAIFRFAPIWNIVRVAPHETSFQEFWNSWRASGNNRHHAVRAIYQNTIDYNTTPRFNPLLPDRTVLQNFTWNQAIDLWAHSEDDESTDAELTWQIVVVTDSRCGVSPSPDNRYVNLAPQQGWLGSCDVTIRVSDSLRTADDTFRVNVVPVQGRIYLPIILK